MVGTYARTVVVYLFLIAVIRFLGKRQLGQMEPSEVVVTMLVADLASFPMEDPDIPLTSGIVPILAVLSMEILLSFLSVRSLKVRKLLCGKPVILMENGDFLQENMRKNRITIDELLSQLRQKDILDPTTVRYAILETGGNLSVFPYPEYEPAAARDAGVSVESLTAPITVVSDGRVLSDNLKKAGKNQKWLEKALQKQGATVKQTFLLTVDKENKVLFYKKQIKRKGESRPPR